MNIHVNRNLALETTDSLGRRPDVAAYDARAELAAQFIPAGSRVLDLSAGGSLEKALPNGCSYQGHDSIRCDGGVICNLAGGDFPTQAAAESDIIVMLG